MSIDNTDQSQKRPRVNTLEPRIKNLCVVTRCKRFAVKGSRYCAKHRDQMSQYGFVTLD